MKALSRCAAEIILKGWIYISIIISKLSIFQNHFFHFIIIVSCVCRLIEFVWLMCMLYFNLMFALFCFSIIIIAEVRRWKEFYPFYRFININGIQMAAVYLIWIEWIASIQRLICGWPYDTHYLIQAKYAWPKVTQQNWNPKRKLAKQFHQIVRNKQIFTQ